MSQPINDMEALAPFLHDQIEENPRLLRDALISLLEDDEVAVDLIRGLLFLHKRGELIARLTTCREGIADLLYNSRVLVKSYERLGEPAVAATAVLLELFLESEGAQPVIEAAQADFIAYELDNH